MMNDQIFLPTLPHWEFGNHWSGSCGPMRFYITNSESEDRAGGKHRELLAEVWMEDVCRELAHVSAQETFPCTQEGLDGLLTWLTERAQEVTE